MSEIKRKANTDSTYCVNENCKFKNECNAHADKYEFDDNIDYWFMNRYLKMMEG